MVTEDLMIYTSRPTLAANRDTGYSSLSRAICAIITLIFTFTPAISNGQAPLPAPSQETTSEGSSTDTTGLNSSDDSNTMDQKGDHHEEEPVQYQSLVVARRSAPVGTTATTIAVNESRTIGAASIADILQASPMVDVQVHPKTGATLQLRGFDEKSSLMEIEGIPLRGFYDGHMDISAITAQAISAIQIERGITSVLNGPNSMGGVITMRMPNICAAGQRANLLLETGQLHDYQPLDFGVSTNGCHQFSKLSLHLGGSYRKSEGYLLSADYRRTAANAQFEQGDSPIRDGSDYQRASISALARYNHSQRHHSSMLLLANLAERGMPPYQASGYTRYWRYGHYHNLLAGISTDYRPATPPTTWGFARLNAHIFANLHQDELDDYSDATYTTLTSDPRAWFVQSAYEDSGVGAAIQATWALNRNNQLHAGLRYTLDHHSSREKPPVDRGLGLDWEPWSINTSHTATLGLEDIQAIGPWRFGAGAAVSTMGILQNQIQESSMPVSNRLLTDVEGRVFADRSLTPGVQFLVAGGRKVRFPTLKELFTNHKGGNINLRAEQALMVETGFNTNHCSSSQGLLDNMCLKTTSRLFASQVQDLILSYRDSYANVEEALIAGGELDTSLILSPRITAKIGYRYLFTRNETTGKSLDFRTPHRLALGLEFKPISPLTASVEMLFNSAQRGYFYNTALNNWQEDIVDSHYLLNCRLQYHLQVGSSLGTNIYLSALNLLDEDYATGSMNPQPGRQIMMGVGLAL